MYDPEYHKIYRKLNRTRIHEAQKQYYNTPNRRARHLRTCSKGRGLAWELPLELAIDLITDNCYYCGAAPEPLHGIDRVDNTRGYLEDNVVTACKQCNKAKSNHTKQFFEEWATRVAQRAAGVSPQNH